MTISPVNTKGAHAALVCCDDCGAEERVTCDYQRRRGGESVPLQGQINKKLIGSGWAVLRGRHYCPTCTEQRRTEKGAPGMTTKAVNVEAIRKPDRDQKRLIILALEDAYDATAGKYHGGATDKTVATDLGDGIMPGWVAELREEFFGPAGNEELDQLRAEIGRLGAECQKITANYGAAEDDFRKACDRMYGAPLARLAKEIEALRGRVEDCVASHDKRVRA